jgi:uncharacterized protein (TIGR03067 family)
MRCVSGVLLVLSSLAFAPVPPPREARPTPASIDLNAMQGRWDRIAYTFGGTKMVAGDGNIRIVGQKVAFYLGDRLRDEWSIALTAEQDTRKLKAKIISGDRKGHTVNGGYRLEGDRLTLTYSLTLRQGLLSEVEQVLIVLTYKRRKP